jgi:hypothetical protein
MVEQRSRRAEVSFAQRTAYAHEVASRFKAHMQGE